MKNLTGLFVLSLISTAMNAQIKYPETRVTPQTETFFDTVVTENFRWLEKLNSEEVKNWVSAQNRLTDSLINKIAFKSKIKTRLQEIWDYERRSTPFTKRGKIFYFKNDGVQNQSVLYYQAGLASAPEVLLDPNTLSKEGTTAITLFSVNQNADYAVVGLSDAGSDWTNFRILNLNTKQFENEVIKNIKFSGASWYKDGFFYSKYDTKRELHGINNNMKVYYHKLGTRPELDSLVYEDKENANRFYSFNVTDDEKIFYLTSSETTSGNTLYFKEASDPKAEWVKLYDGFDQDAQIITHQNNQLYIFTNSGAPNGRLIAVNTKKPSEIKVIIPEKDYVLTNVIYHNHVFVAQYLKDVKSELEVYSSRGKFLTKINLPGAGIVSGLNAEDGHHMGHFTFTSYLEPGTIYEFQPESGGINEIWRAQVKFNSDEYETKQVFYYSKDSTKVPMFLTYKKGIKLTGTNPVFLYGYGGFNVSVTPSFSPAMIPFLENGGIYAVANIRGGGEYGQEWYKAGTKAQKQNVFDDFIAAAEYLIAEKYTNKSKIAICGRSNGGLLVGAVMTQRPDLFKVALPGVGVLDMLHYHQFTIGYAWADDYGVSSVKEEFEALIKYSPLHNIKNKEYPATLVTTADHDDRVVPSHSFKFIAELQKNQKGKNPVLIRVDVNAGHGAGKPTSKSIEEWTDIWTFTMFHLGMKL
ncbi:MAG TPA: prolyl oligopeptidase family serine peptidase [Bacteroidia bacterium]